MASTGETFMTLFAITYLGGAAATLEELPRGASVKVFTGLMPKWLDARKELGVAAFAFASAYGICGTALLRFWNSVS